jgi:transposase-like protein
MNIEQQWCAHRPCADFGKRDAGNIKVHSYVERRFYCGSCRHTFSMDTGTMYETLRSERDEVIHALSLLVERNSLCAVERATHHPVDALLHWLDLAGQHCAAVSADLIHDIRLRQAQIDELWTFVKKTNASPADGPAGNG